MSNGTFNGMLAASDGKIYYVLCANKIATGAQMFSYDPAADKIQRLGDLTEAAGEKDLKAVPEWRMGLYQDEFRASWPPPKQEIKDASAHTEWVVAPE